MKKPGILLVAACLPLAPLCAEGGLIPMDVPQRERCVTDSGDAPFALGWGLDAALVGGGLAAYATAWGIRLFGGLPDYEGQSYDLDDVNVLDRWAARPYSKTYDILGTIACGVDFALLPAGLFLAEGLVGNMPWREGLTVGVMYAEAVLWAQGIKDLLKVSMRRERPYMYFDGYDEDAIDNHDFEFSWPSGHTTNAFLGATFASYVFCQYYPESRWKVPVVAASYAVAAGTGALRMLSGNHFFTDVLTGAALGTAIGFAVPLAHRLLARSRNASGGRAPGSVQITSLSPAGASVSIAF